MRPVVCPSRRGARAALVAAVLVAAPAAHAQQPIFTPDRADGIYAPGERIGWTVTLPPNAPVAGVYSYTIRRFGAESLAAGTLDLRRGRARIETSLAAPAMLIVDVTPPPGVSDFGSAATGGKGHVLLGAAVDPTKLRAAEPKPADFDAFWAAKLRALDSVPMDPVVKRGESGAPGIEYATVRLGNVKGSHVYGQLAKPAREGKFPAILVLQWASPPYPLQKQWVTDLAAQGYLALNVEPHDVPSDMPQAFYDALPALIKQYNTIGQTSRDDSYFLRMYLGDYRAVEYLASRPEWDGRTMVVMGTSMGGQQSFATAGLNPRVTHLIVNVPAGADVTAALHRRWPSYPNWDVTRPDVLTTARYFDTANFASRITAQSLVAMGFIDDISAPAGVWSVFNGIRGRKEAVPMPASPHNNYASPESERGYTMRSAAWLDAIAHGRDPMTAHGASTDARTGMPAGGRIVFADEFDGDALDRARWTVRVTGRTVNEEQQAYVDDSTTLRIVHGAAARGAEGGALEIRGRSRPGHRTPEGNRFDFVSGRLDTRGKVEFTYGIAAARMRLPAGDGFWPAFWVLGTGPWPATGEIDVMENVGDPSWVSAAMHGPGYSGNTPLVQRDRFPAGQDATGWHVYAVEWRPDELIFRVDDRETYRVTRAMVAPYGRWAFDNPKFLILNLALGGGYPRSVNGTKGPPYVGLPDSTVRRIRAGDAAVLVDWVRVTALPETTGGAR
ncbi:MAG TPA: acetylxylan esterase [Gemmatimonadaceae bacterium]|nr:acetylxylan esterase [Gemmatimonadaceae bacterium]